jgi:hypothetical protein
MEDETTQQHVLADGDDKEKLPSGVSGYLHTYATVKDLRLLYVDGTSAGKSAIGTLDSQDRILFNDTITGGVSSEDQRATTVCQLAKNEWQSRLDEVIRMAAGFEIILCEPEVNLVSVRVMPVPSETDDGEQKQDRDREHPQNGQEKKDNGKKGRRESQGVDRPSC